MRSLTVVNFEALAAIRLVTSVARTCVLSWASERTGGMLAAVVKARVAVIDGLANAAIALVPLAALAFVCARPSEVAHCFVMAAMRAIRAVVDGLTFSAITIIAIQAIAFVGGFGDTSALRILVAIVVFGEALEVLNTQLTKALEAGVARAKTVTKSGGAFRILMARCDTCGWISTIVKLGAHDTITRVEIVACARAAAVGFHVANGSGITTTVVS